MSKKNTLLTFKGICMNFLLELRFFILSHPVTSKQPHKIVQIHMGHPVECLFLDSFFQIPKFQDALASLAPRAPFLTVGL